VNTNSGHERRTGIKILVAFDDAYRAYQGTLVATIRILRPDVEVVAVEPEKMSEVAKRFDPDVVIGGSFKDEDLDSMRVWIELALDPSQSTKVVVDGQYSEMTNPTLDKLLVIIEEVAQRKRTGDL
jgi:hypothetical protein